MVNPCHLHTALIKSQVSQFSLASSWHKRRIYFFHLLSPAHQCSGRSLEPLSLTWCLTLCVALCVYWQTLEHQGYTGLAKNV